MKKILIVLSLMLAAVAAVAQESWLEQVNGLMAQGEFAQAEKVMKKLPKKVRKAEAVRIDSLQTIMERIRKDFNLTPEQAQWLQAQTAPL